MGTSGLRALMLCAIGVLTASCSSESAAQLTSEPASTIVAPVETTPTATVVVPPTAPTATAAPAPTESPASPTATSVEPSATTISSDPTQTVAETSDMVYMSVDGVDFLMDVFVPAGQGPWPVVVSFHGCCGDPEGKDIPPTVAVAEEAARQGIVVFTPTWLTFSDIPLTSATLKETGDRVSCAVAVAQESAAQFGGDPATTIVDGFSAGATAALALASEGTRTEAISGCATEALPTPISGFVLGDSESWLHSNFWDGAFDSDPNLMQASVAGWLDPGSWEHTEDVRFFVWTTEDDAQPRPVDDLAAETGWFTQRDPDGTIRADLERLGQLADGSVDYRDAAELLHLRLTEAGFASSLDVYPGSHTTLDKVPEIVKYFQAALTE